MKLQNIEKFLKKNGIKKAWLAHQAGTSPELIRYYCREGVEIPEPLDKELKKALIKLSSSLQSYLGSHQ